jgi:hypothetical protein
MIVGYSAVSNVWMRSGICWVIAFMILTFDVIIVNEFGAAGHSIPVRFGILISAAGAMILRVIGKRCGECHRVALYSFIFGLLGVLPLLAAFIVTCSLSLLFIAADIHGLILMVVVLVTLIWVGIVKHIVDKEAIVENALNLRGRLLFLSRFQVFSVSDRWRLTRGGRRANIFFLASAGILLSYTLQHDLKVTIGDEAVFFSISLVGAPYALWCLLRFAGGLYIWICVIVRLERCSGRRIVFHSSQMSVRMEQRKGGIRNVC